MYYSSDVISLITNKAEEVNPFYLPEVKVTSQEQFVPLMLAVDNIKRDTNFYSYGQNSELVNKLKEYLKPKKLEGYRIPVTTAAGQQFTGKNLEHVVKHCLFYESYYCYSFSNSYSTYSKLGLVYRVERKSTQTIKSKKYPSTIFETITGIDPYLLVVIKAKHIPVITTSIVLGTKPNIPYSDIKILVSKKPFTANNNFSSYVDGFLKQTDMKHEFVDHEVMLSYLVGKTTPKTVEETLEAIRKEYIESEGEIIHEQEKKIETMEEVKSVNELVVTTGTAAVPFVDWE